MVILTHWGRVTHICVSKLTIIASDNCLSPERRQAIIWTNAGILLVGHLGTNFSEILIEIVTISFEKMRLKVSSAKWHPCCLCLNVLPLLLVAGPCYIRGDPMSYTGDVSVTEDGVQCEPWTKFPREVIDEFFPDGTIAAASNFCRNPGNVDKKGPWCFSVDGGFGNCNVLMCSSAGRCQINLPWLSKRISHRSSLPVRLWWH